MSNAVFLSYATRDEIFVRTLARRLRDVGLEPWHYTEAERFGDDYTARLLTAIEQAAAVVVILSADSANSLPVLQEVLHARAHRKRIIPVEIEPCDGPVPFHLRPYYRITCWDRHNAAPEIERAIQAPNVRSDDQLQEYMWLQVLPAFSAHASRASLVLDIPNDFVPLELPAEKSLCMIGRDPRHQLAFQRNFVSRTHARISIRISAEGVDMLLYDLGSTHGTYLNGTRLTGPQLLRDGDQIGFGTPAAMVVFSQIDRTAPPNATNLLPDDHPEG